MWRVSPVPTHRAAERFSRGPHCYTPDVPEVSGASHPAPGSARLRRKRLLFVCVVLPVALVLCAGAAGVYVADRHPVRTTKWLARHLHQRLAGQRTQRLAADITVDPAAGRIDATTTLTVTGDAGRRHFYFLLSPELQLQEVTAGSLTCAVRRVWLVTRVTVPRAAVVDGPLDLTFRYTGNPAGHFRTGAGEYLDEDGMLLGTGTFWYPTDEQAFFTAEVTVTLPAAWRLVTTGNVVEQSVDGTTQRIGQTWPRPLDGLALMAGDFTIDTRTAGGRRYDVYIPAGTGYDTARLLTAMQETDALYTRVYGPSGFQRQALAVLPRLGHSFNDGSALMGVAPRDIRRGDYGYRTIAHEAAHNWWGAVVAERWLDVESGGQWLEEGFAEMSALLALEHRFGPSAAIRAMEDRVFPPGAHRPLADMSGVDIALGGRTAQWTIYRKGAVVATLLRRTLGDEAFFRVCRTFFETYRYQYATGLQFADVARRESGRNLDVFFARWVRGDGLVDLAVSPGPGAPTAALVRNVGDIPVHRAVHVAVDTEDGQAVYEVQPADLGTPQPGALGGTVARLIVDPQLEWPDMKRANNVWPPRPPLRWAVPAPTGGAMAEVRGYALPWSAHQVAIRRRPGDPLTYDFPRALTGPPQWWPDGSGLLVSVEPLPTESSGSVYFLPAERAPDATGPRPALPSPLGHGRHAVPLDADLGTVLCADDGAIVEYTRGGRRREHLRLPEWTLGRPKVSPDGTQAFCVGRRGGAAAVWVWPTDRPRDARQLLQADAGRVTGWWLNDGRDIVVLRGREDLYALDVVNIRTGNARELVPDMPVIREVCVGGDGALYVTGRTSLAYPLNPTRLWRVDVQTGARHMMATPGLSSGDSVIAPAWDAEQEAVVYLHERLLPMFPARLWAQRTVERAIPRRR